ncbi:MAG: hypothetical protein ACLFUH_08545 [Bacteroidales bacterium]
MPNKLRGIYLRDKQQIKRLMGMKSKKVHVFTENKIIQIITDIDEKSSLFQRYKKWAKKPNRKMFKVNRKALIKKGKRAIPDKEFESLKKNSKGHGLSSSDLTEPTGGLV